MIQDTKESYAIRRVNPFLGVLQVVKTPDGRAVSTNGIVWDIEIRVDHIAGWGSLNENCHETAYYRFGLWSQEEGLVYRPLAPHMGSDPLTQQCQDLIDDVQARLDQIPFPLLDHRELWLFDPNDDNPLALLASESPNAIPVSPEPKEWKVTLGANGVPSQHRFPDTSKLEKLIKERGGFNLNKRWVNRLADNSGIVESDQRHLAAEAFPSFLIRQDWPESEQEQLVDDYIEWIAPSLLTLQRLRDDDRLYLEKALMHQAVSIEHHWHLYPMAIDQTLIQAARVKCRLLSSSTDKG